MNRLGVVLLATMLMIFSGCSSEPVTSDKALGYTTSESGSVEKENQINSDVSGRMLIWEAYLSIEVDDVKTGMDKASKLVERFGGYIESSAGGVSDSDVTMKIPTPSFQEAVKLAQQLGNCTSTRITSRDVTDQFVDVQARLKSKLELRDRLRKLLDKATEIKDVIAIETELTRLQGEIESMEGTLKKLQGQVDYATINISFEKKMILGPLGYLFKGVWWGFKKLFVITE